MNKKALICGGLFLFLFVFVLPVEAKEMRLTEGEFVVLGEDPSMEDYINQLMFWDAVLEIDDKGKVKVYADDDYQDLTFSGQLLDVSFLLKMDGEYSFEDNRLSGTFSAKHNYSYKQEREEPLVSYYGNGTMDFSGTFSGGYSSEDAAMKIDFQGTKNYVTHMENSNGNKEDDSYSKKWNNSATFVEDFCANLAEGYTFKRPGVTFIPSARAKDSGARFSDFSGMVTVFPDADPEDSRPAEMDDVLEVEDHIKTEDDSCAIISFADMTTFVMKPMSEVVLDLPAERKSKLSLVAGDIWVNVKKMFKDGSMDVTMNQAVAGIKGTTFVASERSGVSTLKVIEGEVEYQLLSKPDEIISVGAGEMVEATSEGLKNKTSFNPEEETSAWKNNDMAIRFADAPPISTSLEASERVVSDSVVQEEEKKSSFPWVTLISILLISSIGGALWKYKNK